MSVVQLVQAELGAVADDVPTFADFWVLFPKRIARMEAEKKWNLLTPQQKVDALTALVSWRAVWIAEGKLQYVPNASTWIFQQRWTDELPDNWGASHASHVAAKVPEKGERVAMPESVKAAIARLRK